MSDKTDEITTDRDWLREGYKVDDRINTYTAVGKMASFRITGITGSTVHVVKCRPRWHAVAFVACVVALAVLVAMIWRAL